MPGVFGVEGSGCSRNLPDDPPPHVEDFKVRRIDTGNVQGFARNGQGKIHRGRIGSYGCWSGRGTLHRGTGTPRRRAGDSCTGDVHCEYNRFAIDDGGSSMGLYSSPIGNRAGKGEPAGGENALSAVWSMSPTLRGGPSHPGSPSHRESHRDSSESATQELGGSVHDPSVPPTPVHGGTPRTGWGPGPP